MSTHPSKLIRTNLCIYSICIRRMWVVGSKVRYPIKYAKSDSGKRVKLLCHTGNKKDVKSCGPVRHRYADRLNIFAPCFPKASVCFRTCTFTSHDVSLLPNTLFSYIFKFIASSVFQLPIRILLRVVDIPRFHLRL